MSECRRKILISSNVIILLLAIAIGSCLISWDDEVFDNQPTIQGDYFSQVTKDWDRVPFTELHVTDQTSCPDGTELVFERVWYGMTIACDCLDVK